MSHSGAGTVAVDAASCFQAKNARHAAPLRRFASHPVSCFGTCLFFLSNTRSDFQSLYPRWYLVRQKFGECAIGGQNVLHGFEARTEKLCLPPACKRLAKRFRSGRVTCTLVSDV